MDVEAHWLNEGENMYKKTVEGGYGFYPLCLFFSLVLVACMSYFSFFLLLPAFSSIVR